MITDQELQMIRAANDEARKNRVMSALAMIDRGEAILSGSDAKSITDALDGNIKPKGWRALVSSGSWLTGDSLKFSISRSADRLHTVAKPHSGEAFVVEKVGLLYLYTGTEAALDDVIENGVFDLAYPSGQKRKAVENVPLQRLLIPSLQMLGNVERHQASAADAVDGATLFAPVITGPYELPVPMLLKGQVYGTITLKDLDDGGVGTSDSLSVCPIFWGKELIGLS